MERSHRAGLIGLGRIACLLEEDPLRPSPCTHFGAWQRHDTVEVVAGCDSDPERREYFRRLCPGARLYHDYREMLERESLDLLSVAAYATERAEMVEAAAAAGVAGIWCEKATATSLAEAEAMEAAVARAGCRVAVSYMRRWDGRCRAARDLLRQGAIGRLESVTLHFSGNLLHTGTHAFDLLRMVTGEEVTGVRGWLEGGDGRARQSGYRFGGETIAGDVGGFALLELESGARALVHGHDKGYFRFELELLGSEGMIRLGNTQAELWRGRPSSNFTGFDELHPEPLVPVAVGPTAWAALAGELVECVERGGEPACTLADGRAALAVALAIHQSDARGHETVAPEEVSHEWRVASR